MSTEEIIAELTDLTREDVREALLCAAEAVRELPLRHSAYRWRPCPSDTQHPVRASSAAVQQWRRYAARLVAIAREGPGPLHIPGAGGDRLSQLGQPGQMILHRLAAFR